MKTGTKVLMVLASRNFHDDEYEETRKAFDAAGFEIEIASSMTGHLRGALGSWVMADRILGECRAGSFDAIVFIGGYGALEYRENTTAHRLCRETVAARKVLAALCVAPVILARADVLKNRRVTSFPDQRDAIESSGGIHTGEAVCVDGRIITADGPNNAQAFAETVVEALGD